MSFTKTELTTLLLSSSLLFVHTPLQAQWSELGELGGPELGDAIRTVWSDATGNIYAAGSFRNSSGNQFVAKWDGIAWSELGGLNGLAANNGILSICGDASGNIYAAGQFTNSSGNGYVAKWNGTAWSELGGLNVPGGNTILSIVNDASGNIYAAGDFTNSSGNGYVAKWDGTAWSELGGLDGLGADGWIRSICSDASGNVYAAGNFGNSSGNGYVAQWDGSAWSELGGLNALDTDDWIHSVCSDVFGNIYAAGYFRNSSGNQYVAKWDGTAWSELGGLDGLAANDWILSICTDASGSMYAAGWFTNGPDSDTGAHYVAQWDGTAWSELGGLDGLAANDVIVSVSSDAAGSIYAAGIFTNSAGVPYVAKYGVSTAGILNANNEEWQLELFPNPATDVIYLRHGNWAGEHTLLFSLVDLQSRTVLEQSYDPSISIDVSKLLDGAYMATLSGKEKEVRGKVIIQR